ncbi:hypothetical protein H4582DRAFT_2052247 [Lactarius indigo]|nr:hypothetical protein H4582DRAFT_2052247 [Lactarius indigo]
MLRLYELSAWISCDGIPLPVFQPVVDLVMKERRARIAYQTLLYSATQALADIQKCDHTAERKEPGTIVLRIRRISLTRVGELIRALHIPPPASAGEEGADLRVIFRSPVPAVPQTPTIRFESYDNENLSSYVTFVFRYRTQQREGTRHLRDALVVKAPDNERIMWCPNLTEPNRAANSMTYQDYIRDGRIENREYRGRDKFLRVQFEARREMPTAGSRTVRPPLLFCCDDAIQVKPNPDNAGSGAISLDILDTVFL